MSEITSGLIKKLAIGTVQFGLDYGISNQDGKTSFDVCRKIISLSRDQGINTLDTAFLYGDSEEIIGDLDIEGWQIISKFRKIEEGKTIREYLKISLRRLKQSKLYAYIAHDANSLLSKPDTWFELQNLKEEGLISKTGFSLYNPEQLEHFFEEDMIPDLIQIPYNVLDRRFEYLFEEIKERGIEIHTRSSFLQGLFFMKTESLHPFFKDAIPEIVYLHKNFPSVKERASSLLSFVLTNPHTDKVVMGINNEIQLLNNIEGFLEFGNPPPEDLRITNEDILLPNHWKLD